MTFLPTGWRIALGLLMLPHTYFVGFMCIVSIGTLGVAPEGIDMPPAGRAELLMRLGALPLGTASMLALLIRPYYSVTALTILTSAMCISLVASFCLFVAYVLGIWFGVAFFPMLLTYTPIVGLHYAAKIRPYAHLVNRYKVG